MKTERRHELQTNDLADWLGRGVRVMEDNARTVVGVLVAVAIIVAAYFYFAASNEGRHSEGWNAYFMARQENDITQLNALVEEYRGTPVGAWAQLALADDNLITGTDELFASRGTANDRLRAAADGYQAVLGSRAAARESLLRQRATWGLARSLESLNELDRARELYAELADRNNWTTPLYSEEAKWRLADLEQRSTKEFYDWFAQHEPTPEAAPDTQLDFDPLDLEALPDDPAAADALRFDTTPFDLGQPAAPADADMPAEVDTTIEADAAVETDLPADPDAAADPLDEPADTEPQPVDQP